MERLKVVEKDLDSDRIGSWRQVLDYLLLVLFQIIIEGARLVFEITYQQAAIRLKSRRRRTAGSLFEHDIEKRLPLFAAFGIGRYGTWYLPAGNQHDGLDVI